MPRHALFVVCLFVAIGLNLAHALTLHRGFAPEDDIRITIERPMSQRLPANWSVIGNPAPKTLITLSFALKHQNLDRLHELFTQVSEPTSPKYGQYLTRSELTDMIAPPKHDLQLVQSWLETRWNVPQSQQRVTLTRDFVVFNTTVFAAEKMLQCRFYALRHTSGVVVYRSLEAYSLPYLVCVMQTARTIEPRTDGW
jgi:subtilase family serine protease